MANDCGCGNEVILVGGGLPGPQGPAGPQGPPGPGVSFPIPASDISVTNVGFANLQEVLDYLLYDPMVINSFVAQTPTYLIGSSVSTVTFLWALNKPATTKTITGPNLPTLAITTSPTAATLSGALSPVIVGTVYTYTLAVSDGTTSPTANTNITFLNNIYFGDTTIPGAINSAFVNTLGSFMQAGKGKTVFSNATGPTTYAWFASRAALGGVTFTVNGFPGGFENPVVIAVTNSAGFTESYNVYRSTNPGIGPVTYVTS